MGKKNKSRKAQRTGSPIGDEEDSEYEVTEEAYEVECVVAHRNTRRGMEYKVRWRGWSPQFDEWLHYSKMDCPEAIKEYWQKVEKKKSKEASPSKKREHTDLQGVKPSSSKINALSSPPAKRRAVADSSHEANDITKSKSKSPIISEPLRQTTQQTSAKAETPKEVYSEKDNKNGKSLSAEVTERLDVPSTSQEENKAETQDVASTSSHAETLSADALECSSQRSSHQRTVPPPPAFPKRKLVQSLPNTSTSSQSSASHLINQEFCEVSAARLPEKEDLLENTSSIISGDKSESKQGPEPCEVFANNISKVEQSVKEKPFVRPHGFERGLTVERIHGFIRRADLLFAVVQFKNCDVVEILATQIVKHYEPMALIRGFEEHNIRSRRNAILSSSQSSEQQQA